MKGFQRAVGCLLAVGFLGQMPTPVIAAETPTVIEMPYASSLTAKDGSIRVVLQDSRKVHVTIQKMTQEGSDAYYDVVLDPTQSGAATTEYVFYLDCCEYNLSTASYVSTYQLTIADESTPEAVYTETDIAIFQHHLLSVCGYHVRGNDGRRGCNRTERKYFQWCANSRKSGDLAICSADNRRYRKHHDNSNYHYNNDAHNIYHIQNNCNHNDYANRNNIRFDNDYHRASVQTGRCERKWND